jgi:chromate transporter
METNTAPLPWANTLKAVLIWGMVWITPMILIALTLGTDHVLWRIGFFFTKLSLVSFGGAYAVLAYMAQQAVQGFGWLHAGEMADGLGLAETTPGPLIMVTQYVGFLAAFRTPAPFSPLFAGVLGAALTTWVTFTPCFLWIFTFAPWIERLQNAKMLRAGLAAITAAIVGVIANLTAWFALHVIFHGSSETRIGGVHFALPDLSTLDWRALLLTLLAGLLLLRFRQSVIRTLGLVAVVALIFG